MLREIERDSLYHCDPGVLIILPCQDKKERIVITCFIVMTCGFVLREAFPEKHLFFYLDIAQIGETSLPKLIFGTFSISIPH